MTAGAEIEVTRPQVQGCQQPPEKQEVTGTDSPLHPRGGRAVLLTPCFGSGNSFQTLVSRP